MRLSRVITIRAWVPMTASHSSSRLRLNLRQIRMAGEDDVPMQIGECLTEGQVVLVDEEPGRHVRLCRQRTQLLLVGDRGPYLFGGHLVAADDLLD